MRGAVGRSPVHERGLLQQVRGASRDCRRGRRPCLRKPASWPAELNTRCSRHQYGAGKPTFLDRSYADNGSSSLFFFESQLGSRASSARAVWNAVCSSSSSSFFLRMPLTHDINELLNWKGHVAVLSSPTYVRMTVVTTLALTITLLPVPQMWFRV